jgi:mRNA-degrading endonuclease RelE of RelBE toxin-antitoxin system
MRAIDRQSAIGILRAIDTWVTTKQGDVTHLRPPLGGLRLRVGDWRVLFKPLDGEYGIEITSVLHRSKAYRRM